MTNQLEEQYSLRNIDTDMKASEEMRFFRH